ncbi:DUF1566 domain-containing protein [Vibrio europaeus]|uniref:Lcl domain-containing protein n=1 Tax=Vibrio europaeus TaxID=300876 RepID=UPI002341ED19|nr:DUF1566 domain-containing protein [Vibrio europaeus]MDC5851785.1 DUF1566 domain-containing protein [Vibrio europaeus]
MKNAPINSLLAVASLAVWSSAVNANDLTTPIVDTNQSQCFGLRNTLSSCPSSSDDTFGQDAQYQGNTPSYTKNSNGTVSDKVTGLMWTQSTDLNGDGKIDAQDKLSYDDALDYVTSLNHGGYSDWRLPSIKELYSLILFDGQDPSGVNQSGIVKMIPFLDSRYFDMNAGDVHSGERLIDSQFVSSTKYVSTTMNKDETVFGVNFIDGRIKGYGIASPRGGDKTFYVLAVRGNPDYGINQFTDNNNGTITDSATSLIWQQSDSQSQMDFPQALAYCENLELAGRSDWRLPSVKELQSIVDYTRSPATSNSAAIDPIFNTTAITSEANREDYANYWSSTTHENMRNGGHGAYVAFGSSLGYMRNAWIDVHGAGSQRSDPKTGDASQYPTGHGPQGDAIRIDNMVRCVAGGGVEFVQQPTLAKRPAESYQNGDTASSMSSKGKQNMAGSNNGHFSRMDRNGDGKISRLEAKGKLAKDFSRFDRNNDGYLTQAEMPSRK